MTLISKQTIAIVALAAFLVWPTGSARAFLGGGSGGSGGGGVSSCTGGGAQSNKFLSALDSTCAATLSDLSGYTGALGNGATGTTQTAADNSTKLATTAYVDSATSQLNPALNALYATTGVLPNSPAYLNGASGIGATLISTTFGALTVDGQTAAVGDRVLVKDQASSFQNGIYTVTVTGSGAAFYTLTRALDFDTSSDILIGTLIGVGTGTTNAGTVWRLTTQPNVIGTDAISFSQFQYALSNTPSLNGTNTFTGTNTFNNPPTMAATNLTGTIPAGTLGTQSSVANFYRTTVGAAAGSLPTTNATSTYMGVPAGTNSATEAAIQNPVAVSAKYLNLRCRVAVAPGTSNSYAFTLRDGGSNESLTCTISAAATSCSDTTAGHAYSATAGTSLLVIGVTTTVGGSAPSSTTAYCGMEEDI